MSLILMVVMATTSNCNDKHLNMNTHANQNSQNYDLAMGNNDGSDGKLLLLKVTILIQPGSMAIACGSLLFSCSRAVLCSFTICSLFVQMFFTVCSQVVHYVFSFRSLCVHLLFACFTVRSLTILCLFTF